MTPFVKLLRSLCKRNKTVKITPETITPVADDPQQADRQLAFRFTGMNPEAVRQLSRTAKNLKGLFLNPPIYRTAVSSDNETDKTQSIINK